MTDPLPVLDDAESIALVFDDVRLAGYVWRSDVPGPAFLLLHGWGEDASTLAPLARRIAARGGQAVSISMRGWRGSTGIDDYGRSAAADIGRVLEWVRRQPNVDCTVLLGFSMGGVMAGLAAAEQTELAGVIVVSAPSHLPSMYAETAYGGVRRYFDATLQPDQWRESSPLTHAHRITRPMLIVTGLGDTMTPASQGRLMAEAVSSGQLLEMPRMQHHPSPEEWERILNEAGRFMGL